MFLSLSMSLMTWYLISIDEPITTEFLPCTEYLELILGKVFEILAYRLAEVGRNRR